MHLSRLSVSVSVLGLTLFVAACGGPAAPTAAPTAAPVITQAPGAVTPAPTSAPVGPTNPPVVGTIDACTLLTPAELSAALGETYTAGVPSEFGPCAWNIEGETGNGDSVVSVYLDPQAYSFVHSVMGIQEGAVDITVAGHSAFYNPLEFYNSLWVDAGGAGTLILGFPRDGDLDPSYQAFAVQLAEIALTRI